MENDWENWKEKHWSKRAIAIEDEKYLEALPLEIETCATLPNQFTLPMLTLLFFLRPANFYLPLGQSLGKFDLRLRLSSY